MLPVWQHEISPKSQFSHILTTVQGSFVDPKGQQMLTKISPLKSTTFQVSKTVSTILLTHFVKKVANFKKVTQNDKSTKMAEIMKNHVLSTFFETSYIINEMS